MNQQRSYGNHPPADRRDFIKDFQNAWITSGLDKKSIEYAEEFGRFLTRNNLTTSQIRNVYGELKRIQMKGFEQEKTAFLLLKPKMAYAVARDGKRGLSVLTEVFNKAFNLVDVSSTEGSKHYENLMDFMESVLAYHKAFGGK